MPRSRQNVAGGKGISLRLVSLLVAGFMALVLALAGLGTHHDLNRAAGFLERAGHAHEQLALVTRLEADMNALLLDEAARVSVPEWRSLTPISPQDIERTLALYMASIRIEGEMSEDEADKADQAEEISEAIALRDLFRAVQEDLSFLGAQPQDSPVMRDSRSHAAQRVAARMAELRLRAARIVKGEQKEVEATAAAMNALRKRFAVQAVGMLALVACAGLGLLAFLRRGVVTPLAALAQGTARLAAGESRIQVTPGGVRELRALAGQFNLMAARIAGQQAELQGANERLEGTVAERTRDLEAKTRQLAAIDRSRRLFFAKVGHELRTPVTVLRGEAEVALRNTKAGVPTLREALTHIRAHGEAMQRRLEDLLALAHSEEGRIALHPAPFDLAAMLRGAVEMASAFAQSSGVVLASEGDEAACPLTGDESWLRQALLALIDNAVKFSPEGGTVRVSLQLEGAGLVLGVADEGPGAPEEALAQLFDPYFQGDEGARRGGSGLGLAVARWIAEQHGGTIRARNRAGGGLAVELLLPLTPPLQEAA